MEKVIKDGKVAVLYSPGWDGGWYTNHKDKRLLFHPTLVKAIEVYKENPSFYDTQRKNGVEDKITQMLKAEFLSNWASLRFRICSLEIKWVPVGITFTIYEYDNSEQVVLQEDIDWITA